MVSDNEIDEIIFSGSYPKLVQDGYYDAVCKDYSKPYFYYGTRKISLTFELLNEPYSGTELFMHLHIPLKGISPGSNYSIYWTMVHGRPPSRNANMSPRIFKNKYFRVKTRTVKRNAKKREIPPDLWYSVIDDIELKDFPDTEYD